MGFKMNGSPAKTGSISGTAGHASALKMVEEQKAASALKAKGTYESAKKADSRLDEYIKARSSSKKGSAEYNAAQNKINKAYGAKTRHGVTSTSDTKGRKTGTTTTTPGEGTKTSTKTNKILGGTVSKTKTTNESGDVTKKTKLVKREDGTKKKSKVVSKNVKTEDGGNITKKTSKIKYDKEGEKTKTKVKSRVDVDNDGKVDRKVKTKKNLVKGTKKKVVRQDGRRTVTKTDAEGNVTTKSKRTLKGFLTGKGKKKKDSPADMYKK